MSLGLVSDVKLNNSTRQAENMMCSATDLRFGPNFDY